eukprot:SAG22_NODE_15173_length_355_cov_0.664062_1_plen_91_part_10
MTRPEWYAEEVVAMSRDRKMSRRQVVAEFKAVHGVSISRGYVRDCLQRSARLGDPRPPSRVPKADRELAAGSAPPDNEVATPPAPEQARSY